MDCCAICSTIDTQAPRASTGSASYFAFAITLMLAAFRPRTSSPNVLLARQSSPEVAGMAQARSVPGFSRHVGIPGVLWASEGALWKTFEPARKSRGRL